MQRFNALVRSSSWAIQHVSSLHASRCTDENKYASISDSFGSKRKEDQEPDTNPQQSPNVNQANKAQQTRSRSGPRGNVSTQRTHGTGILLRCDEAGCGRAYAKPVQLTNYYKEDHPSLGLKRPFLCDKCVSKFK